MAGAALIDGRPVPDFPVPQEAIVEGDSISLSIAAASVIAKVQRDRVMDGAASIFPEDGFEKHKGYGTRFHLQQLRQYGPCPIHRRSFRPVAEVALSFVADRS
jgi:ribonuclease HII